MGAAKTVGIFSHDSSEHQEVHSKSAPESALLDAWACRRWLVDRQSCRPGARATRAPEMGVATEPVRQRHVVPTGSHLPAQDFSGRRMPGRVERKDDGEDYRRSTGSRRPGIDCESMERTPSISRRSAGESGVAIQIDIGFIKVVPRPDGSPWFGVMASKLSVPTRVVPLDSASTRAPGTMRIAAARPRLPARCRPWPAMCLQLAWFYRATARSNARRRDRRIETARSCNTVADWLDRID